MFTSISAGVDDLPCSPTFFLWSLIELKIPNFSLNLSVYFFVTLL